MITWDGTTIRCDGVAICDAEARRGQQVRISRTRNNLGEASYAIDADGPAEAAWLIGVPAQGPVTAATIRQEV
ncbi:MAG: hypothetical protein ABSD47_01055 [Candidatus Methylomirabilota bacterium]|jgi:hypothetical protein